MLDVLGEVVPDVRTEVEERANRGKRVLSTGRYCKLCDCGGLCSCYPLNISCIACTYQSVSNKDHYTNKEVRAKIQRAIGPHEDLLTIVKRRKLHWYGHVSRSSGLAKTILQGTVKGGRRQSRQRKRWEDNTREWTGLEFGKSQKAVENRGKWRKLVAKSSVVPQRPSRLRD